MPSGGARENSGGSRVGAGRKKKPLADKLLDGNPGKAPLMVMKFPDQQNEPKTPPSHLSKLAKEIYEACVAWLSGTGCLNLVPPWYVETYAACAARWRECDAEIGKHGKLVKHKATGDPVITPYAAISDMYYKQMITADRRIWEIVKDNSQHKFSQGDMHGSVMEGLISRGK